MGAGDLAVPKKIQKMGAAFYGLLRSVAEALDGRDADALATVLERNIYGGAAPAAPDLAAYVIAESDRLAAVPLQTILAGGLGLEVAA
jgi:cytochrome b pre-mRNA-processing protein 3